MFARAIEIQGRPIGEGHPPYIVAELSANHGGRFERAAALVRAAKDAGADAVKLQTFTAESLTIDCDRREFLIEGTAWSGRRLHDLYREAAMPWSWQPLLQRLARELGIALFSTPFCRASVEFLETLSVPAWKIASFELVDHQLLRCVAGTGRPIVLSTGVASLAEIEEALDVIYTSGGRQLLLLHCTSDYPAPITSMNLRRLDTLGERFRVPVGLSDHSVRPEVAVAAVARGAVMIETHVTLSRADGGLDAEFSLQPDELRELVLTTKATHEALGTSDWPEDPLDRPGYKFRRSLFAVRDVQAGEALSEDNVRVIRPGDGLHPRYFKNVLGRRVREDIARGTPLRWEMLEDE